MSTTVTLEEDVLEKVKAESEARGTSVDGFEIKPFNSGPPRYNLDCIGRLLDEVERPGWR